jgi:hypothetical protein
MSHSGTAPSQLRPNKGQPDVSDHSHPRPQQCSGTSGMILKKRLYILLYQSRKFFNRERGHNLGNACELRFGLGKQPETFEVSSKFQAPISKETPSLNFRSKS